MQPSCQEKWGWFLDDTPWQECQNFHDLYYTSILILKGSRDLSDKKL